MSDIDLKEYQALIAHAPYYGQAETSESFAYEIDNGLSEKLGFANGQLSQADYFLVDNNTVQIIELTRLADEVKESMTLESFLTQQIEQFSLTVQENNRQQFKKKTKSFIGQKVWAEVIAEFKNKWIGSIAILERYCRRIQQQQDFDYAKFLIILTNDTESNILDSLTLKLKSLEGMNMQVKVCRTCDIDKLLITNITP